jgi:hypothetical protein
MVKIMITQYLIEIYILHIMHWTIGLKFFNIIAQVLLDKYNGTISQETVVQTTEVK